jgi:hypothetical protein
MRVDVEDVFQANEELAKFERIKLDDIEFYRDGKKVEISKETIEQWKYIGLNNADLILNYDWPD